MGAPGADSPDPPVSNGDDGLSGSEMAIAGWVIGGAGVVGIAIGSALGIAAMGKRDRLEEECTEVNPVDGKNICEPGEETNVQETAQTFADGSTVAFAIGGVLLAGGIVLILTAPSDDAEPATEARLIPVIGPSGAGLTVTGTF